MRFLNSLKSFLKFTYEKESNNSLAFSDIQLKRNQYNIETCIYRKPTHTGNYLNFSSFGPIHNKIAVVKSLSKRIETHHSNRNSATEERNRIFKELINNNYPKKNIEKHFYKQRDIPSNNSRDQSQKRYCSIPYSYGSERIARILKRYNIITTYQSAQNLRQILRHSDTKNISNQENTTNVIYKIPCQTCQATYIGETDMYVAVMYGGVVDVERVARGLHMLVNEGLGILTGNIAGMFSHPDGYRSTRLTDFRGSPMGSPLSTIIAEIVMTRIDNWITHTLPTDIQFWRRYIDDVFCVCKKGQESFILSTLNNYNQDISFTLETETNHVLPFLDILIIRTPSSFHTTVYHKKQCPPCYTHYNSHCPTSHKIKIVRTLTKRISTHCSIDIFKIIERNRIITQLSMASFPLWFINKYTYTPASSNPSMTYRSLCFLPYSPSSVDIARKLKSYGIRTIYKNSPNLLSSLRHPHTKSSAPPAPLRSVGAVYSVSCEQCPATYVGETGRSVSIRMTEHSRNISRQDTKSLIYQHMQTTGHTFNINNPTIHYSHIHILHQRLILESIAHPHKTQQQLLNARIKNCFSNIRFLTKSIKGLITLVSQNITLADLSKHIIKITTDIKSQEKIILDRHHKKLLFWKKKYALPYTFYSDLRPRSSTVINLSDHLLTPSETSLLEKGLKYRIPSKPNPPVIISAIESSIKSFNLQEKFSIRSMVAKNLSRPFLPPPNHLENTITLKKLKLRKSIVITRSDKGANTVILNQESYISKMHNLLSDDSTFLPITDQTSLSVVKDFRTSLLRLKKSKSISPEEYTSFTSNLHSSAYIYGLPKIHKPEVPLRPIIAYHLSPAYPLAKYLSSFLSPLLTNYNNTLSINSTPHFINELTALKPDPAYTMCSFDVTSLYLCLPHELITDGLTHFLQSQNVDSHTSSTIVQLTKTCLSMNTFSFLQHHYRQFRGSPMGSPLSTIIAEIVMTRIDNWITHTLPTDIQFWRRYIDDVFCVCKKGQESFILSTLNNYNQDISFTLETETNHVLPFLDILIIRTPSSFHTTVYHKKQCPPCYTHYNSHCPTSHKITIVRTLTKRISTHCSIDIFKIIERNRIITQLSMASFPLWFINKYTYTPASSNPSMTYRSLCFLPYSPSSVDIARKLKSYGIRTIYKNSPNLLSSLRHPHTKSSAPPAPLRSVGAVYSVSCEQCPATYVGETGRSVSIRMTEHSRNISRQDTKSLIYQHMQTTGHTFNINNPTIHYSHIHILHQRLILESIVSHKLNSINRKIELPDAYHPLLSFI
ncbi:hypothetical protein LAZ67_9002115 [Cordylochernes scorpioides]|uniref:Reverse transcriptase domain-containing protein n=1 Tax=Cordylochernes scorpioides TaxID=51811 RepID=A0ABY6KYI8_9ARAC|nr:hypothetical protein LAZ67_9002115 [Cordylochernes scorpioides]